MSAQTNAPAPETPLNLMPMPASIQRQPGRMPLDAAFTVALTGKSDARLTAAAERLERRIAARTGLPIIPALAGQGQSAKLSIQVDDLGQPYPQLGDNESYSLTVTASAATLHAPTTWGALHGMETFLQLVSADQSGYFLPLVTVQDQPRFAWRGLMMDVSRHFQPVDVVRRNIDGLAAVKMNVLHWHLSDDQGFRVESKKFPKLQEMGSDGQYYTQDQIREVVEYAAARGVRVVPEFDMPGHTTSWMVGYPELASAPGPYQIERHFGIFDPTMNPIEGKTYKFLDEFLGEMAKLFPDEFLHIGGDENNGKQWKANADIQAFMQKHNFTSTAQMQEYFSEQVMKIVEKHGKRVIGWDEILTPDLPKNAVVQGWHGTESLAEAAREGHNAIWSTAYYLDHMAPSEYLYLADPIPPGSPLSPEDAKHIIGGEVCAWAEYLSPEIIDSRIWPRTAAVAERFWSPQNVRDVNGMYRRLDAVNIGLEQDGLHNNLNTAKVLRQASGTRELGPVAMLAQVTSPEGVAQRQDRRIGTVFDPLMHVTDAATPDPPFRRKFEESVDQLLSDAPRFVNGRDTMAQLFVQWRQMPRTYAAMVANAPVLADGQQRVGQLSQLGTTGLEALQYLQQGTDVPAEWKDNAMAMIDAAEKPDASILKLPWLGSYRALILAAANVGKLKSDNPQTWKQQMQQQAASMEPVQKYTW